MQKKWAQIPDWYHWVSLVTTLQTSTNTQAFPLPANGASHFVTDWLNSTKEQSDSLVLYLNKRVRPSIAAQRMLLHPSECFHYRFWRRSRLCAISYVAKWVGFFLPLDHSKYRWILKLFPSTISLECRLSPDTFTYIPYHDTARLTVHHTQGVPRILDWPYQHEYICYIHQWSELLLKVDQPEIFLRSSGAGIAISAMFDPTLWFGNRMRTRSRAIHCQLYLLRKNDTQYTLNSRAVPYISSKCYF